MKNPLKESQHHNRDRIKAARKHSPTRITQVCLNVTFALADQIIFLESTPNLTHTAVKVVFN